MYKVGMISLGCPKNQVDAERMLAKLDAAEFEVCDCYDGVDALLSIPAASSTRAGCLLGQFRINHPIDEIYYRERRGRQSGGPGRRDPRRFWMSRKRHDLTHKPRMPAGFVVNG